MIDATYKQKLLKEKRNDKIIFCLALAVTLLFHAILYFAFSAPVKSDIKKPKYTKQITVLDLNHTESRDWLKHYSYADPTLIVKPNQSLGFSSLCSKKITLHPMLESLSYRDPSLKHYFKPEHIKFNNTPNPTIDSNSKFDIFNYKVISFQPTALASSTKVTKTSPKPKYTICKDQAGNEYHFLKNEKSLDSLIKNSKTLSDTVFEFEYNGKQMFPSIKIISSSGNSALDNKAYKLLLQKYKLFNLNDKKKTETITIEWNE